jgi:hypothetical protein
MAANPVFGDIDSAPDGATAIKGFLGDGALPDFTRLYLSLQREAFLDVPNSAIVGSPQTLDTGEDLLYVKVGAKLQQGGLVGPEWLLGPLHPPGYDTGETEAEGTPQGLTKLQVHGLRVQALYSSSGATCRPRPGCLRLVVEIYG